MIRFVCALFSLMAFVSPWFIGGNYPYVRTVMLLASGAILAAIVVTHARAQQDDKTELVSLPLIWLALIVGLGYTTFQALPLSAPIQQSYGQQPEFISSSSHGAAWADRAISVYAPATRSKLVDLLYGVGLFVAACSVLRSSRAIWSVFASITLVGALVSFVGILQILSGDTKILWTYELLWGGAPFGSFVNPNNAAGFLLVSLSTGMFFVANMVLTRGQSARHSPKGNGAGSFLMADNTSLLGRLKGSVNRLESRHLYFLTGLVVITAGILMTGSRSGIVTLTLVVLLSGVLLSRANAFAVISLTVVLVASSAAVVAYSEQADRISVQLQSLSDLSEAGAPRLQHWEDALPFGIANAALGTGNGTYRYISPGFQKSFVAKTFAHAENVYLETLVEMGVVGVILLLLSIAYCFHASISLYRKGNITDQALGVVGISCIGGQAFIGTLDFGIYQPANTTVMALTMGAVVGRYCKSREAMIPREAGAKLKRGLSLVVIGLLGLATVWAVYESYGIESKRSAKRSIKLLNHFGKQGRRMTRQVSLDDVRQKLKLAEALRPDDADVQFLIGDLEISEYRLIRAKELGQAVREELKGLDELELSSEEKKLQREQLEGFDSATIWSLTAVPILHQELRARQRQDPKLVDDLLSSPGVREHLVKAMERFENADVLYPFLSKTRVRMALLAAISDVEAGTTDTHQNELGHITEALSRAIPKTQTLFSCGLLALNSGNQDLAVELWRKCLRQPHLLAHEKTIVELCLQLVPMRRLYEEIFPQNPKYLLRIAWRYMRSPEMLLPKKFLVVHLKRLIDESEDITDLEKKLFLAQAARHINDYPAMVQNYSDASKLASLPASSRYDYAFALFKTKQFDEAVRQLKVCELDPSFPKNRTKQLDKRIRTARSSSQ